MKAPTSDSQDISENPESGQDLPLTQGELMSEIAPNIFMPLVSATRIPKHVICRLEIAVDGTYRLVPCNEHMGWVCTTAFDGANGMPKITRFTLTRLARAGFIDAALVTPKMWLVNVDSVVSHILKTRADAFEETFWSDERKKIWAEARY